MTDRHTLGFGRADRKNWVRPHPLPPTFKEPTLPEAGILLISVKIWSNFSVYDDEYTFLPFTMVKILKKNRWIY